MPQFLPVEFDPFVTGAPLSGVLDAMGAPSVAPRYSWADSEPAKMLRTLVGGALGLQFVPVDHDPFAPQVPMSR